MGRTCEEILTARGNMMEKNLKKVILSVGIALTFITALLCQPAYGSVQSNLKKDKGVKYLTDNICFYVTSLYSSGDIKEGDTGRIQMNYVDRFNIATILTGRKYNKYLSYDGIEVMENGSYYCPIDKSFAHDLYAKLFRKSTYWPDDRNRHVMAKRLNGNIYIAFGEFGQSYPSYSIKAITKIKKGTFKVKAENKYELYEPKNGKKFNRIGYTWVTLKKDKKAKYGYKVVKCSYKMFQKMR